MRHKGATNVSLLCDWSSHSKFG